MYIILWQPLHLSMLFWNSFNRYSNVLSKPLTAFQHNHRRRTVMRGMNPVTKTIINPLKEYWSSRGSNQQPPVLKSSMLHAELAGIWLNGFREDFQRFRYINLAHNTHVFQGRKFSCKNLIKVHPRNTHVKCG